MMQGNKNIYLNNLFIKDTEVIINNNNILYIISYISQNKKTGCTNLLSIIDKRRFLYNFLYKSKLGISYITSYIRTKYFSYWRLECPS